MEDIAEYIDRHFEEYVQRLAFLCSFETLAAERRGFEEGAARVASMFEAIGGNPRIIPYEGTPYVVTHMPGTGDHTLAFYNHFDTYPIGPLSAWETPPFELTRRDNRLIGRGACDNKGNIVARLSAVEAYKAVRGELPMNILFFQDAEEEIGSPTLGKFINHHTDILQADGWIWEAGGKDASDRLEIFLGAHGILYVNLEVTTAAESIHGSYAGSFPNAIWRLVWALNTIQDEQGRVRIPHFYDAVQPVTAEMRDLLASLPVDLEQLRNKLRIADWPENVPENRLSVMEQQYVAPYASIIGMGGGHQAEGVGIILPHRANARLGFFLVPDQDPDDLLTLLRDYLIDQGFGDVKITVEATLPPAGTPPTAGLARCLAETAAGIYDPTPAVFPSMRGISPMGYITKPFGVPVMGTGVGYIDSRIHQPNENIRIEDFVQNIKLMAAFIESAASVEDWG